MKIINNFNINTSDLPASTTLRQFDVSGEKDSEFILQVFNSSGEFYNFGTQSFATGFTTENSLKVKMASILFNGIIYFPTNGSGDTYTILLLTPPDKDTELGFGTAKNSYSTTITQVVDTTLTFGLKTSNTNNYATFPTTVTATSSPAIVSDITKSIDWTILNASTDVGAFGLRLIRQPIDTDWVFQTTETVDGAVSSGTAVTVDDLTDLVVGMHIVGVSSGSLSRTPVITAINTITKTLTISSAQTFADGITLTFNARGSSVIQKAIGTSIDFSAWNAGTETTTSAELTKTVRTTATGTTILLDGTYGISGGGFVSIAGINIVNTAANTVQTVSAAEAAGSVVMEIAQTIKEGSKIHFTGSTNSISISSNVTINTFPSSNRTIHLLVDNFITPGVSGS